MVDSIKMKRREWSRKMPIRPFVFECVDDAVAGGIVWQGGVVYKIVDRKGDLILCIPNASFEGIYSLDWPEEIIVEGSAISWDQEEIEVW